jgi:threonine aldolase
MFFASDNTGPVHPKIMERIIDVLMNEVHKKICDLFDAPEATVYLVVSGTAANSLSLACNTQPWQTFFALKWPISAQTNATLQNFIVVEPNSH